MTLSIEQFSTRQYTFTNLLLKDIIKPLNNFHEKNESLRNKVMNNIKEANIKIIELLNKRQKYHVILVKEYQNLKKLYLKDSNQILKINIKAQELKKKMLKYIDIKKLLDQKQHDYDDMLLPYTLTTLQQIEQDRLLFLKDIFHQYVDLFNSLLSPVAEIDILKNQLLKK